MNLLLGFPILRGYVKFPGCIYIIIYIVNFRGVYPAFLFGFRPSFRGETANCLFFHRIGLSGTIDDSGQGMITEERLQEFLGEFCFFQHGQKMRKKTYKSPLKKR